MNDSYDTFLRIVGLNTPREQRLLAIRDFALALDWTPSYEFHGSYGVPAAEDHLVVEHGLENSAIISFLKTPSRSLHLDSHQTRSLLTISYNNLIEWHVFASDSEVSYVNNLSPSFEGHVRPLTRTNYSELLSASYFERITADRTLRRTHESCDDAFINVLSRWKRLLKADYRGAVENKHISSLFNALILIRGCEDHRSAHSLQMSRVLLDLLEVQSDAQVDVVTLASEALRRCGIDEPLTSYIAADGLFPFRQFDRLTAYDLFRDFYRPSSAPYDFNFALMSKHALSRIYERYVSLLEFDEDAGDQLSFVPPVPTERSSPKTGAIYTPQYVAGFFSRYLRENLTARAFRNLRTIDPACGSGIFLRTILELQSNPLIPGTTLQTIRDAFAAVTGIDRDPNACEATFLSLALLYLVATGTLPKVLDVRNEDAVELAINGGLQEGSFGAAIANPPYIKQDHLSSEEVRTITEFLGSDAFGRPDSYLAFVKLCLGCVEQSGFVCLVLPQTFLFARNAAPLRKLISRDFHIRCLVDLSEIRVFEKVGTYNVLLIVQKKSNFSTENPLAQIAKVQEFVGPALQACLDRKRVETPYYRVFEVGQQLFESSEWALLSPADIAIQQQLQSLRPIAYYLEVRQGFVSGADDIFIRPKRDVAAEERDIFLDFLPDRLIFRYAVPSRVEQVVFYPYLNGKVLSEAELRRSFPETWQYLTSHRPALEKRRAVTSGDTPWWRPVRPRDPDHLLRPKIVSPHLMLTPRFAIDLRGRYAVSHSPFLITKDRDEEDVKLRYFCAVMNSSVSQWYLSTYLPKYGRSYTRVEVSTIRGMPVPDFSQIQTTALAEVLHLVDSAIQKGPSIQIDLRLDELVCSFYGLHPGDLRS